MSEFHSRRAMLQSAGSAVTLGVHRATGQTGGPAPYIGSVNIYINDQKAFDAAGKQHGPTLVADVPHFSSVMPIAFPTTVHAVG